MKILEYLYTTLEKLHIRSRKLNLPPPKYNLPFTQDKLIETIKKHDIQSNDRLVMGVVPRGFHEGVDRWLSQEEIQRYFLIYSAPGFWMVEKNLYTMISQTFKLDTLGVETRFVTVSFEP